MKGPAAYRTASLADEPALRTLWKECFGDGDAFIDAFFGRVFSPENCVLAEASGEVCAMAHLLPCSLEDRRACPPAVHSAAYIYGMCTKAELRKKGIGLGLLDFAAGYLSGRGVEAAALLPADEGLFRFYEKAGYEVFFEPQIKERAACALVFPPETEAFQRLIDKMYGQDSFSASEGEISGFKAMLKRLVPGLPEGGGYMEFALD